MDALRIRTADDHQADRVLGPGSHALGGEGGDVRLCIDRRGAWLQVEPARSGVLVNGRPVRRMAMLRVGDTLWLDGRELLLLPAEARPVDPVDEGEAGPTPHMVLRGIGGQYHGRCFTLDRPRTVGRLPDCDIQVDDPAFPDRHARLEQSGGGIVLAPLAADEDSIVNGEHVRGATLRPWDQVVFDTHHRFVLESPGRPRPRREPSMPDDGGSSGVLPDDVAGDSGASGLKRLPWLLLAALLIAAALSALLLSGGP